MSDASSHPTRLDGYLVVGGKSHDLDFVRLELLKLLAEHEHLRVTVAPDFEDVDAIAASRFLLSYSCDVRPSAAAEAALEAWVTAGGRWFALHATNSHLDWTDAGVASAHGDTPFFRTLGSAFLAHPPMGRFEVGVTEPDHPLVEGIAPFRVYDELYLCEFLSEPRVLLSTEFGGPTPGFVVDHWPEVAARPVMYLNPVGRGEVLYLTLGHARGHYDAPHRTPYYPQVERCAWENPEFYELLRRGLRWSAGLAPFHRHHASDPQGATP